MISDFFLASFILRFAKWLTRSAFKFLILSVILGFFIWLFFDKLGYGEILMQYIGYFLEFLGIIKATGSKLY